MDIEQIIDSMTPEVYQRLATAVELGKWPDGVALTPWDVAGASIALVGMAVIALQPAGAA